MLAACADLPPPGPPPGPPPRAAAGPASHLAGVDERALDPSVSPCTDFYRHACGGWLDTTPIPAEESSWTRSFDVLSEANERALREILERYARGEGQGEPNAQRLGDYYAACMDEAAIERQGAKGLEPLLRRIDALATAKDLPPLLAALHAQGIRAAFDFDSGQDFQDATQVIGIVAQGGLGLPDRDYYLDDEPRLREARGRYREHVAALLRLVGESARDAAAHAEVVIAVETALARASMDKVALRDPRRVYHRVDRDGLAQIAPHFGWNAYFEALGVPRIAVVNVAQPEFLKAVDAALDRSPASFRAYLRYHVVAAAAGALSSAFVDETFRFQRALTGVERLPPRWRRCVRSADVALGEALARPFAQRALGAEGKQAVQQMVAHIEGAMADTLARVAWMDAPTRARAAEKLGKIANKVGYPDRWRSYDALVIARGDHLGNRFRAFAFEARRQLDKIGRSVDRTVWETSPATVNAFYEATLNEMVFPAGILQAPFYAPSASLARNYGAIGMIVGHELTHGFDDEGRQFDGAGNLRSFWSPAVSAEFERRAACVVRQFDGYAPLPGVKVNGKLTLGENIADLGGLRLAYAAFVKDLAAHPDQRAAAAFSDEQQFFLGFAQAWCTNLRDEALRLLVQTNPHAPPRFRVNGPVSNMPEFAAAFSCPADSPMVRSDRCEVW